MGIQIFVKKKLKIKKHTQKAAILSNLILA